MTTKPEQKIPEPKMDAANLFRGEVITDRKAGTIHKMMPIKPDGSPDPTRKTIYIGEAQMLTAIGPMPLNFEIEAATLDEAVAKYGAAAKQAFDRAMQELQELRRQASSSIVLPDRGGGPGNFGPGTGGIPGGGKIKLR